MNSMAAQQNTNTWTPPPQETTEVGPLDDWQVVAIEHEYFTRDQARVDRLPDGELIVTIEIRDFYPQEGDDELIALIKREGLDALKDQLSEEELARRCDQRFHAAQYPANECMFLCPPPVQVPRYNRILN